tara:strand:+ start:176 stop:934 length:759 start_codon:yes stop_codon:yes gene_type:complete
MRGGENHSRIIVSHEEASRGVTKEIKHKRIIPCDFCQKNSTDKCTECLFVGYKTKTSTISFVIPPGTIHGELLRIRGMGNQHTKHEHPGDLLITVEIEGNVSLDSISSTGTCFLLPWSRPFIFTKYHYNLRYCTNCAEIVEINEIMVKPNLIATRDGSKSMTTNTPVRMVAYNTKSGFSPVIGNTQNTQFVNTNFGKYRLEFVCPKCSCVEIQNREVEINVWTNANGDQVVEPKRTIDLYKHNHSGTIKRPF